MARRGVVSVPLSATAFDEEDFCLLYEWDCGTGDTPPPTCDPAIEDCCGADQSVTCQYTTEGTFTATVTVNNRCDAVAQDNLTVQINP